MVQRPMRARRGSAPAECLFMGRSAEASVAEPVLEELTPKGFRWFGGIVAEEAASGPQPAWWTRRRDLKKPASVRQRPRTLCRVVLAKSELARGTALSSWLGSRFKERASGALPEVRPFLVVLPNRVDDWKTEGDLSSLRGAEG